MTDRSLSFFEIKNTPDDTSNQLEWLPTTHAAYPRPDWVHQQAQFALLDGTAWSITYDDDDVGTKEGWGTTSKSSDSSSGSATLPPASHVERSKSHSIRVPYAFQYNASSIGNRNEAHPTLWYYRTFSVADETKKKGSESTLNDAFVLHFGAVDYEADVYVDGTHVCQHRGGHVPFSVDITNFLNSGGDDVHALVVRAFDPPYDLSIPRGKQHWVLGNSGESIFYTPTSGLWQSVWLERFPSSSSSSSDAALATLSSDTRLHAEAVLGKQAALAVWPQISYASSSSSPSSYEIEAITALEGVTISTAKAKYTDQPSKSPQLRSSLALSEDHIKQLPKDFTEKSPLSLTSTATLAEWHEARKRNDPSYVLQQPAWSDHGVALWSPAHPALYTVTLNLLTAGEEPVLLDTVTTQIGARDIDWRPSLPRQVSSSADGKATSKTIQPRGALRLNGQPYFYALFLDQGYWIDTGLTAPPDSFVTGSTTTSPAAAADDEKTTFFTTGAALANDIRLTKELGFDGVRKHQKLEDPRFLYWADRLGMLVWSEMASAYVYTDEYKSRFEQEWLEAVRRDRNHASVIAWTPANESWAYTDLEATTKMAPRPLPVPPATWPHSRMPHTPEERAAPLAPEALDQRHHLARLVALTKQYDPTRPVNDNCGWQHVAPDLATFHDYSDAPQLVGTAAHLVPSDDNPNAILGAKENLTRKMFVPVPHENQEHQHKHEDHFYPEGYIPGMPVLNTEFGGINITIDTKEDNLHGDKKAWGYTTAKDPKDLLARVEKVSLALSGVKPGELITSSAGKEYEGGGVRGEEGVGSSHTCGFVYTQLADCEQEQNGLLTRFHTHKLPPQDVQAIVNKCRGVYFDALGDWEAEASPPAA